VFLIVDDPGPRERWPLSFRVALAMVAGAAAAWWIDAASARMASERMIEDPSSIGAGAVTWGIALCAAAVASVAGLVLRWRLFREWSVTCVGACVGCMLALDSASAAGRAETPVGIVTLEGTVATEPRIDEAGNDELSEQSVREASQSFRLAVDKVHGDHGQRAWPVVVTCRVGGMAPLPARGTRIRATGWMRTIAAPRNPGQREREPTVLVSIMSSRSIERLDAPWMQDALTRVRASANGALRSSMPHWADDGTRALVQAMTTGVRLPGLSAVSGDFRDAGMSHVLAISGFNVAVLVGSVAVTVRMAGIGFRTRAVAAAATAVAFLALTEPDTSVVRAGLGAGLAAAASLRGGNARGLGTLGAVALASMLIDIDCITGAGFQLSYGVVVALLVLAPGAVRRCCACTERVDAWLFASHPRCKEASGIVRAVAVGAVVSSLVAWTVSTPIALWHGGSLALAAAPLSVLTMPVAAGATVFGVIAMVAGCASDLVSAGAGAVAASCASVLSVIATATADSSVACIRVPQQAWWACAGLAASAWWMWSAPCAAVRLACAAAHALLAVAMVLGAFAHAAAARPRHALTVESLAIARGGCWVVRTDHACMVVNCGSWSSPQLGSGTVVPALLAVGVRRIDALVLVGQGLGSASALPEVLGAVTVKRIVTDASAHAWITESRDMASSTVRAALRQGGMTPELMPDRGIEHGDLSARIEAVTHGKRSSPAIRFASARTGSVTVCTSKPGTDALLSAGKGIVAQHPDGAAVRTLVVAGRPSTQRWDGSAWR